MQSERAHLDSAFEEKVENSGCVRRLAHLVLPLFTKNVRSRHASWNVTPRTHATNRASFCHKRKKHESCEISSCCCNLYCIWRWWKEMILKFEGWSDSLTPNVEEDTGTCFVFFFVSTRTHRRKSKAVTTLRPHNGTFGYTLLTKKYGSILFERALQSLVRVIWCSIKLPGQGAYITDIQWLPTWVSVCV